MPGSIHSSSESGRLKEILTPAWRQCSDRQRSAPIHAAWGYGSVRFGTRSSTFRGQPGRHRERAPNSEFRTAQSGDQREKNRSRRSLSRMRSFHDYSIPTKLTWMNLLVSSVALGLACAAFMTYSLVASGKPGSRPFDPSPDHRVQQRFCAIVQRSSIGGKDPVGLTVRAQHHIRRHCQTRRPAFRRL